MADKTLLMLNNKRLQISNSLLEKFLGNLTSHLCISDRTIIEGQSNKCDRAGFWIAAPLYDKVLQLVKEEGNE